MPLLDRLRNLLGLLDQPKDQMELSRPPPDDARLGEIIATLNAHKKSSHPWTRGKPFAQVYYEFVEERWEPVKAAFDPFANSTTPASVTVISWNIDFMRSLANERMSAALKHLELHVKETVKPCVVMLNEMTVSDLALIQAQQWVQKAFLMTDISNEYWESGYYGTCVLIPKILPIAKVFRVHYEATSMERDALFIDVRCGGKTLRICSTHLESLIADPPKRPAQVATAAKFMHEVDASILGGDLNAIQPFDKTLHSENNLKDAYLETGGVEDAESGMTWGQMASTFSRNKFGLSRMDKLFFCGAVSVQNFQTFGMNAEIENQTKRELLKKMSGIERAWVTDHLGIKADFLMNA